MQAVGIIQANKTLSKQANNEYTWFTFSDPNTLDRLQDR